MNKQIILIFLLFFTLTNIVSKAEGVRYFVDNSMVSVRKNPDNNSGLIGSLTKDQELKVIEKTEVISRIEKDYGYWVKIQYKDTIGYVFGGFINCKYYFDNDSYIERKQFIMELTQIETTIMVIDSVVDLYEFPSNKSLIISSVNIGDTFSNVKYAFTDESIKEHKYWYYIKTSKYEGFLPGNKLMKGVAKINSNYYGINEYPIDLEDEWEHRFVQTNSELVVFSKDMNKVIQRFIMPDSSDCIKIFNDFRFNKILGNRIIIIEHSWNQFSCCPIGYQGNVIYSLDEEGRITTKLFSWFKDIGAQDEPSANLEDIIITDFKIVLNYDYAESSGFAGMGEGKIKILYYVYRGSVIFNKIESSVIQTYKVIDGSLMFDDEHKLKVPLNLKYTKDELNEKFLYLSKVNPFIY